MNFIFDSLLKIKDYKGILKNMQQPNVEDIRIIGPSESQKAHVASSLLVHGEKKGVFIAFNEMHAKRMYEDFSYFLGDEVVFFPSRETILHDVSAKSYENVFERIRALEKLVSGDYRIMVTSAEAAIQKVMPKKLMVDNIIEIKLGGRLDLNILPEKFLTMGYERVDTVEGTGQFAIRGGIIDIYSVGNQNSIRIEMFDDEVDSIRSFDIFTQRSFDNVESFKIIPARDLIYDKKSLEEIIVAIENDLNDHLETIKTDKNVDYCDGLKSRVLNDIERFRSEYYFPGMDRYIPYFSGSDASVINYFKEDTIYFIDEPSRISQRIDNLLEEFYDSYKTFIGRGLLLPRAKELYDDYYTFKSKLSKHRKVILNALPSQDRDDLSERTYTLVSKLLGSYSGHLNLFMEDVKRHKENKLRLLILAGPKSRGEKLLSLLQDEGIDAFYIDNLKNPIEPGQIAVTHGSLNKGFQYPELDLVVISDKELFGQERKHKKASKKKTGRKIDAFTDLNIGDFVVHESHGIGQYEGIQQLVVMNIKRDYLKIKYKEEDYLYIPTSQLDLIQKYIGSEGNAPKLSRLGGSDWQKVKKRVKESLKEIAEELVKLYAKRQASKGFAYSNDNIWQKQFEDMFPYEETDDQLKCIQEIKDDMQSELPMDRLLCGDVGYGKTEVALRAIFKAIMDGKQVAYLVPTTILAQQQYNNFKERMRDFPVSVDVISRFRSRSEQKAILKGIEAGSIDVLLGTHRLIQKDIKFKDLGLLVVDEEQRFGVSHKEKLKNLKPNIDVLTLTATPIPRTLHMSLSGIRDISVIEDPPEERRPVQTYVIENSPEVIRDAIQRELSRNGQVFYLYNYVRSIEVKASELQALVPDARIVYAHGQMDENRLEEIMEGFIEREYDVLICTTIIESGLDMPNVNTIIVENADRLGLAQLYQLRGRVGRSNRQAYAYITYKKDKVLTEIAEKRLKAIMEFTEFGSGFKIAMRDLEIRGAGNLLGGEQHGHLESVGYDMYCRLLDEAVRELKGEEYTSQQLEITIDIKINAYIDNSYITKEAEKIEMYKKIASINHEQDIADVEDELIDRYGDIPDEVSNLIQISAIKLLARECGFSSIIEKSETVVLQYMDNSYVNINRIGKLMELYKRKILFTASNTPYLTFKQDSKEKVNLLRNIKILLQDINKLQQDPQ